MPLSKESKLTLGQPPLKTVQLLHELPDGTKHIDWMIARDSNSHESLLTFRTEQRVDCLTAGSKLELERIGDHRQIYLDYEGEISGNRGKVTRIATGTVRNVHFGAATGPPLWRLEIEWIRPDGPILQIVRLIQSSELTWTVVTCTVTNVAR